MTSARNRSPAGGPESGSGQADGFNERSAELLARQFNTAFTTASSYGHDHPLATRAVQALHETLTGHKGQTESLTLILDRGALFIENHPVGQRFNPRRLINQLARMTIESITFEPGIELREVVALMETLSDGDGFPTATAARAHLEAEAVEHIRLNYIVFRKVTADQKVVDTDSTDAEAAADSRSGRRPSNSAGADDSFGSLASLLSLTELVRNPGAYAGQVSEHQQDDARRPQLVRQLRNLTSQVESGQLGDDKALSSEEVLKAVNRLRDNLRRKVDADRDMEQVLAGDDQVLGEIDQLTYSTLVSLVREEYRSGTFSPARLAQIIQRMLPDARDLRRLLPQLKQGLFAEGMTPLEYGKLIKHLSGELKGEQLVRALEQGADSVGLDVDEIVDQIRDDPAEAARLIVMATELRRSGVTDEQQLSSAFSDYIERISERLINPKGDGESGALGLQLKRVQELLIDQLHRQGLPSDLISELKQKLDSGQRASIDSANEAQAGTTPPQIPELPPRVLNPTNTAFFLKREIKSAERYKTPFAVIKLSIELLREPNGKVHVPSDSERARLLPKVYEIIVNQMRDLDLVGSLDKSRRALPLLILPMTEAEGAEIVHQRLRRLLGTHPFRLASEPLQLLCASTMVAGGVDETGSADEFFQQLQKSHEQSRQALLQAHTGSQAGD
ncbi:MAG: hypothetical protein V2J10_02770 [Wenzhouxiangella sp.]|jgi:hypothetical protein|nr:hypothetical protein [Wenzhouxiangella sp.]